MVKSHPITAHLGIISEHKSSFVGCITPTMNLIKSHLSDCASGVARYYKRNKKKNKELKYYQVFAINEIKYNFGKVIKEILCERCNNMHRCSLCMLMNIENVLLYKIKIRFSRIDCHYIYTYFKNKLSTNISI